MTDREMGRTQARRRRTLSGVAVAALGLGALAPGQGAEALGPDLYLAPGYFAGGLTSASTWDEISTAPREPNGFVASGFPHIGFGVQFIPLDRTCLAEGKLQPREFSFPGQGPIARDGGHYAVGVFRQMVTMFNPARTLLFNKIFDVPVCPPR